MTETGGRRWRLERIKDLPENPGVYILFHHGKRKHIGETENLRKKIKQHLELSFPFTEFTWYITTLDYRYGLANRLKRTYREELEEK